MTDEELIMRMALLHRRLRLRSPATTAEKLAWREIIKELENRYSV